MPDPQTQNRTPEKPDQQPWRVEGARDGGDGAKRPTPTGGGSTDRPRFRFPRWLLWLTLVLLLLNVLVARQVPDKGGRIDVPYSFFRSEVDKGNVSEVNAQGDIVQGEFKKETKPGDAPED